MIPTLIFIFNQLRFTNSLTNSLPFLSQHTLAPCTDVRSPLYSFALSSRSQSDFDGWCDYQKIVRVGVITSRGGVAGRGLFSIQGAQSGSVVASIPANCVFAPCPDDDEEWQVSLTKTVLATGDDSDSDQTWIREWEGGGHPDMKELYRIAAEDGADAALRRTGTLARELARHIPSLLESEARSEIDARLKRFERRLPMMEVGRGISSPNDLVKWYCLVLSRAGGLGYDWNDVTGIGT
mmetsp:Transcript_39916/g.77983  ORF Transcript_39916/g.77983 Transcript_39916/m.77983 type:complete len:238 (+) Transcript_39916:40-753(+)